MSGVRAIVGLLIVGQLGLSAGSVAASAGTSEFAPVSPRRVFDTRLTEPQGLRPVTKAQVGGEYVLEVQMTDLPGATPAAGVGAVSLNVTATQPSGAGFVTVYPCGTRPVASNLNFITGQTVANAVVVPLSAAGMVCFYSLAPVDLIADINGWFPTTPSGTTTATSASTASTSAASIGSISTAATADRYIVRLAPGTDPASAATAFAADGWSVLHTLAALRTIVVSGPARRLGALARNPHVLSVERDQQITVAEPAGTFSEQAVQTGPDWGLDRIDQRALPLSATYEYPAAGEGVKVYVVDSGIRADHTEFTGRVAAGFDAVDDLNDTNDCDGHGTHVAGTIGGTTYGVAKRVTLIPVRVLDCSGIGSGWQGLTGLQWVIDDHQPGQPAVVNMSLGGAASPAMDAAVQAVVDDGIVVVVAAGNVSTDACQESPARAPQAITVAASDANDDSPSWSDKGPCVDLFAPGVQIRSAGIASTTDSLTLSGTSMASPHVAGVAAVLLSLRPSMTPAEVANRILGQATAGIVSDAGAGTPNRLLYMPPEIPDLFFPLAAQRVFDTRPGEGGLRAVPKQQVGGGYALEVQMTDLPGLVPASGVSAVSLNLTVTQPQGAGYVTVFPCGTMPLVSSLNYAPGQTVPNAVIAPVSPTGTVCFFSLVPTDLIADINGWFAVAPGFTTVPPARVFDTRPGEAGLMPVAKGKVGGGYVLQVQMTGVGGLVPVSGVGAVSLNVTATQPEGAGFVTVFPCGTMPVVSSLNYGPGQTVPNAVITPVSPSGTVCFYSLVPTDLIADINGWFAA